MLFKIILLLSIICSTSAFGVDSESKNAVDPVPAIIEEDEFYLGKLGAAYTAFQEKDYKRALEKLDIIKAKAEELDWRYYTLRGQVYEALEEEQDAIENYTFSLTLHPAQPRLFKKLYEINTRIRKPIQAFEFIRLYLAKNDDDIPMRYRALILAKRLAETKYVEFTLKKIRAYNKHNQKKKEILANIGNLNKEKKYKEALQKCREYLPFFPEEETLHRQAHIAQTKLGAKSKEMESLLIDSAVILSDKPKYQLKLALYYKEQRRLFEALNLFRRIFYLGLEKEGEALESETLLFLKEGYYALGKKDDVRAIDSLLSLFSDTKNDSKAEDSPGNKDNPENREPENQEKELQDKIAELNSLRITYSNNREFLIYLLYITKKNNLEAQYKKYREILTDRDDKKADSEFMNVYSVFVEDDFRNLSIKK